MPSDCAKPGPMNPETLSRPWLAHTHRVSVFPVEAWSAPADLWEKVTGEQPEMDEAQPRQFVRMQAGPWQGALLQVSVNPVRVDWVLSPSRTDGSPGPMHLPLQNLLPKFYELTRGCSESLDFR